MARGGGMAREGRLTALGAKETSQAHPIRPVVSDSEWCAAGHARNAHEWARARRNGRRGAARACK